MQAHKVGHIQTSHSNRRQRIPRINVDIVDQAQTTIIKPGERLWLPLQVNVPGRVIARKFLWCWRPLPTATVYRLKMRTLPALVCVSSLWGYMKNFPKIGQSVNKWVMPQYLLGLDMMLSLASSLKIYLVLNDLTELHMRRQELV